VIVFYKHYESDPLKQNLWHTVLCLYGIVIVPLNHVTYRGFISLLLYVAVSYRHCPRACVQCSAVFWYDVSVSMWTKEEAKAKWIGCYCSRREIW